MAIIAGDTLSQVVAELSRRDAKLYHACQLADFRSYLQLGGVPSRNLVASRGLPYTTFDTDGRDGENEVWRLVFFNLSDFGYWFGKGANNLPNIYGPILLCFDPAVLLQATNVSIALRSAAGRHFDRDREGINASDVPRLFVDADSQLVRFASSLEDEFARPGAKSPEMSCSFHDEIVPLSYLAYIRIDPYALPDGSLMDIVRQGFGETGNGSRVFKRRCEDRFEMRYQVLLDAVLSGVRIAPELSRVIPDGSAMSDWRDAILRSRDLSFQFGRYARYLFEGTVN